MLYNKVYREPLFAKKNGFNRVPKWTQNSHCLECLWHMSILRNWPIRVFYIPQNWYNFGQSRRGWHKPPHTVESYWDDLRQFSASSKISFYSTKLCDIFYFCTKWLSKKRIFQMKLILNWNETFLYLISLWHLWNLCW